ncbi:hypothetical protein ACKWTF_006504 [Chironomus riparius]
MRMIALNCLIILIIIKSSSQMRILCKMEFGYTINKCNAKDVVTSFYDRQLTGIVGNSGNADIHQLIITYSDMPYLPLNISENFPKINYLKIYKSNVQHLMTGDLSGLYKLKTLDLSNNAIEQIGDDFFKDLSSLEIVNFDNCHLKKISPYALDPLINLLSFSAENNECINLKTKQSYSYRDNGVKVSEFKRSVVEKCSNTTHTLKSSYQETCDDIPTNLNATESSQDVLVIVGVIFLSIISGSLSAMLIYMKRKVSSWTWNELKRQNSEN